MMLICWGMLYFSSELHVICIGFPMFCTYTLFSCTHDMTRISPSFLSRLWSFSTFHTVHIQALRKRHGKSLMFSDFPLIWNPEIYAMCSSIDNRKAFRMPVIGISNVKIYTEILSDPEKRVKTRTKFTLKNGEEDKSIPVYLDRGASKSSCTFSQLLNRWKNS